VVRFAAFAALGPLVRGASAPEMLGEPLGRAEPRTAH
jgi:hypothetical protein